MQPMKSDRTTVGTRHAWEPPTITKLAIGTETKSSRTNEQRAGAESAESGQAQLVQPSPPADPTSKLGFAFEMAFPLSTRFEG